MGKRLVSQRGGKGSHTFKAKQKGTQSKYLSSDNSGETLKGEVTSLFKESGRNAIMAEITFRNGKEEKVVAAEGLALGQKIEQGKDANVRIGNISELGALPEGCPIFNVEKVRGDGGTLAKSSGGYALMLTKSKKKAYIKMPSSRQLTLPLDARATIGNASCGGRGEKPFVKAGNKYHSMKAKKKVYPRVRGVAMNALDHPFGGSQHHAGQSKSTAKNAPPGRKVGAIGSKRTGKRKK